MSIARIEGNEIIINCSCCLPKRKPDQEDGEKKGKKLEVKTEEVDGEGKDEAEDKENSYSARGHPRRKATRRNAQPLLTINHAAQNPRRENF